MDVYHKERETHRRKALDLDRVVKLTGWNATYQTLCYMNSYDDEDSDYIIRLFALGGYTLCKHCMYKLLFMMMLPGFSLVLFYFEGVNDFA